jgi:hypothetical protein
MSGKLTLAAIAFAAAAAGAIAVQPVLAAPQQPALTLEQLRQEVWRLEARVARLEKAAQPRLQPSN